MDVDLSEIDWKSAYRYFIWDVMRYRSADIERITHLIFAFFKDQFPSPTCSAEPYPWDKALLQLMRSLRHHLGSNIFTITDAAIPPKDRPDYTWLNHRHNELEWQPSKPYIDWFLLEKNLKPTVTGQTTNEKRGVSNILFEMEKAYEQYHRVNARRITLKDAWNSIPFYREFSGFYGTEAWGIPIPFFISEDLVREWGMKLSDVKGGGTCYYFNIPNLHVPDLGLQIRNREMGDPNPYCGPYARLCLPSLFLDRGDAVEEREEADGILDLRRINLVMDLYLSLIVWVEDICAHGKIPSPTQYWMKKHDKMYCDSEPDTQVEKSKLELSRQLWQGMRALGLRPIYQIGRASQLMKSTRSVESD